MGGFLPIIFIIVIGLAVKAGQNQQKKDGANKPANKPKPQSMKYKTVAMKPATAHGKTAAYSGYFGAKDSAKPSGKKTVEIGTLKDDRKNDWLAQQLKEEKAVLRRREYLDLGAAHRDACAADALKLYHADNCDADSVDTGSY